jgi:type IV secretion system protein VirB9
LKTWLLIFLLMPTFALAEISPGNHPFDSRVRVVDYNPLDVVKVTAYFGVSTIVQFDTAEVIKEVAIGDESAWNVVPRGNHFFLKPKQKKADTNVTVVTDKRTYHFSLYVAPRSLKDASAWRDPELVYGLTFRYPEEEAKKLAARKLEDEKLMLEAQLLAERQAELAEKKAHAAELKKKLEVATKLDRGISDGEAQTVTDGASSPRVRSSSPYPEEISDENRNNFDYWVAGSTLISPTGARDDGRFTYLLFSNSRDMPAVYMEDEAGKESLIETHVEGNTIVVHLVLPKLTLRRGAAVACIRNKSFDSGIYNDRSGTVSSGVRRTVKEAE